MMEETKNTEGVEKTEVCEATNICPIERQQEEVYLRVYDLSNGMAKSFSEVMLGFKVDGIWHTSLELYGNEYFFQNGLVYTKAGFSGYGAHIDRISLGTTDCTQDALHDFFEASRHAWHPASYDLFDNNCNHFSDYLARFLLEKGIPEHILELPERVKKSPMFKELFVSKRNGEGKESEIQVQVVEKTADRKCPPSENQGKDAPQ